VVANEVRSLAQRSATASKEIKVLINGSVSRVAATVTHVNQSGEALRGIVASVQRVGGLMDSIAGATREQSLGVDQVNKAVLQMNTITQRNASQTEELTATAVSLSQVAQALTTAVGRFRLGDLGARTPATPPPSARRPPDAPRPTSPRAPSPRQARPTAPPPDGFEALPSTSAPGHRASPAQDF
jgi:hypothetical protein